VLEVLLFFDHHIIRHVVGGVHGLIHIEVGGLGWLLLERSKVIHRLVHRPTHLVALIQVGHLIMVWEAVVGRSGCDIPKHVLVEGTVHIGRASYGGSSHLLRSGDQSPIHEIFLLKIVGVVRVLAHSFDPQVGSIARVQLALPAVGVGSQIPQRRA